MRILPREVSVISSHATVQKSFLRSNSLGMAFLQSALNLLSLRRNIKCISVLLITNAADHSNHTYLFIDGTEGAHAWLTEVARIIVSPVTIECVNLFHVFHCQEEVKYVSIFFHAFQATRFRDG